MEHTAPSNINQLSYKLNLTLVGPSKTGKSALLNQFTYNNFKKQHQATLGVEFGNRSINIGQYMLRLQIWDTAGLQSFKSIIKSYYRTSCGAIIMYDITNRQSFQKAKIIYQQFKKQATNPNTQYFFLGNKLDLEKDRKVCTKQGEQFAKNHKILFTQITVEKIESVNQVFYNLADAITKHNDMTIITQNFGINFFKQK